MRPYYPLQIPSMPASNYVTYPLRGLGELSCDQQWDQYNAAKKQYDATIGQLTAEAQRCATAKEEWQNAVAARDACDKKLVKYEDDLAIYRTLKTEHDACLVNIQETKAKNERYRAGLAEYEADVARVKKENQKRRDAYADQMAAYETELARVQRHNTVVKQAYQNALRNWEAAKEAHEAWKTRVQQISYNLAMTWYSLQRTHKNQNTGFNDYTIEQYGKTYLCPGPGPGYVGFYCATEAMKRAYEQQCRDHMNTIRGLGASSGSPGPCQKQYMPTCPSCPPFAPDPGPPPTLTGMQPEPSRPQKPALLPAPQLKYYLEKHGAPPELIPQPCDLPVLPPEPTPPQCDPPEPGPEPPCTVPNLPDAPVKPPCEPKVAGIGLTGLLLAAVVVGGVAYAAKKKKRK